MKKSPSPSTVKELSHSLHYNTPRVRLNHANEVTAHG